jgi:hypothetical protein
MLETRLRSFGDNTGGGASASTAGLVSSSLTINTNYPLSGGGNLSQDRTFSVTSGALGQMLITSQNALGGVAWVNTLGGASGAVYAATGNSYVVTDLASDLTNEFRLVQSGNSTTVNTAGNLIIINAVTSPAVAAGTGLALTGSTFTVNTNIRDRSVGIFYAGSLSSVMAACSAMIYIPFNMELLQVRLAVSHSAGGQNIQIQPILWDAALQAKSSLIAEANRPKIITNNLVGSHGALGSTVLHAGSWLGCHVDSVGTTVIGSNMTVNFIVRTS